MEDIDTIAQAITDGGFRAIGGTSAPPTRGAYMLPQVSWTQALLKPAIDAAIAENPTLMDLSDFSRLDPQGLHARIGQAIGQTVTERRYR